jgi:Fic family protein
VGITTGDYPWWDRADRALTPEKIKEYNRLILAGLELEEGVVPGEVAPRRPAVGRYLGPPREDCDHLLAELCDWLNSDAFDPPNDDLVIPYAILKAVTAHLYVAWIHYFGDGNGRTARCVELQILVASGRIPTPAGHLPSNHYNITRDEYYRQLDASSREHDGNPLPFLAYAVRGFVEELRNNFRPSGFSSAPTGGSSTCTNSSATRELHLIFASDSLSLTCRRRKSRYDAQSCATSARRLPSPTPTGARRL